MATMLAPLGPTHKVMLRLTLTSSSYGHPYLRWVARDLKSVSNRLLIRKIHFRLSERHNSNMNILSPENPFAEMILFWVMLLEKMWMDIEPFVCSANQRSNGSCILGGVVGDSLMSAFWLVVSTQEWPNLSLSLDSLRWLNVIRCGGEKYINAPPKSPPV